MMANKRGAGDAGLRPCVFLARLAGAPDHERETATPRKVWCFIPNIVRSRGMKQLATIKQWMKRPLLWVALLVAAVIIAGEVLLFVFGTIHEPRF